MSTARVFGKSVIIALVFVVAADLVGVAATFLLDVVFSNVPAIYALWLVVGVFCGMLSFNFAGSRTSGSGEGDWSTRPGARRTGWIVLSAITLVIAVLAVACWKLAWPSGSGDYFVPDNMPISIMFFLTVVASTVFANTVLMPTRTDG